MAGQLNIPNREKAHGDTSMIARLLMVVAVVVLVFVHLFVTFRGLYSPMAMDQAQIARELARGNGFQTKVVRPYTWKQSLKAGRDESLSHQSDTFNAPLPSLVMAPIFKALSSQWDFGVASRIYPLDRVIACLSILFFLGAVGISYLTVQRLFDDRIAGWMVVGVLACEFLWDVARSGLAPMMLLFFLAATLHLLVLALERKEEGRDAKLQALGIGLMAATMLLTHWMAVWLVLGLVVASVLYLTPRHLIGLLVVIPSAVALGAWAMRNHAVCGDFFGASKALFQGALLPSSVTTLLRDFSGTSPAVNLDVLVRKLMENLTSQLRSIYEHLGCSLAAALFLVSLLHPFKRSSTSQFRWALAIIWLSATVGMVVTGLPDNQMDDNQLHCLFIPLMSAYGLALLAVMWARLRMERNSWWAENGFALIASVIGALPMLTKLPTDVLLGLHLKGEFAHWPPYLPDRLAKLREMTTEKEVLFTDAPCALAWYADRTSVWLPMEKAHFNGMKALLGGHGDVIAGFVMTPVSARCEYLGGIFNGEYRSWAAQIYRGMTVVFGVDLMAQSDFPYKLLFPLAGQSIDDRYIAEIVFMSDSKRWEKVASK